MAVALAGSRQTVVAPTRAARRFGLFSVAEVVDGGEAHWVLGGLTAEGELCSKPRTGQVLCGALPPGSEKVSDSWYADLTGDPWIAYMYEKCRTVGRFDSSESKVRERFLGAEQSAAERGFQTNVLANAVALAGGAKPTISQGISALEAQAAQEYGSQIILHMPFQAAEEAKGKGLIERQGDHLETIAGSLVAVGNYLSTSNGGTATAPVIYATGGVVLHRSELLQAGPEYTPENEYFTLAERVYAALVDCFLASTTATIS